MPESGTATGMTLPSIVSTRGLGEIVHDEKHERKSSSQQNISLQREKYGDLSGRFHPRGIGPVFAIWVGNALF
jgi:hypothetical protein